MATSRIWFTAAQKAELWERWKRGSSSAAISRALDRRNKAGVLRIVMLNGGIAPAPRRRALAALRLGEREEISRGIAAGQSIRQIALGLDRAQRRPPTLPCQPGRAERLGTGAASQALSPGAPQRATMAGGAEARAAMVTGADSGWLKRQFPTDEDMQISDEAS